MDSQEIDERVACYQCRWLRDECLVAKKRNEVLRGRGIIQGDFPSWKYRPHPTVKRRCEFYRGKE